MRNWSENKRVVQLSELWQRPVVSGGDRHGCEPSGALNLTRATNFSAFRAGNQRKATKSCSIYAAIRRAAQLALLANGD